MKQEKRNFWLDTGLFVALLSAAFSGLLLRAGFCYAALTALPRLNQHFLLTAHIGSGLTLLAGSVTHMVWHRAWLKALRRRSIASLPQKLRANRVTDRLVWITFLATVVFGALSWVMPAQATGADITSLLHGVFGMTMLLGNIAHLALHSKWIVSTAMRQLQPGRPNIAAARPASAKE